jgi:hypothetical protein
VANARMLCQVLVRVKKFCYESDARRLIGISLSEGGCLQELRATTHAVAS